MRVRILLIIVSVWCCLLGVPTALSPLEAASVEVVISAKEPWTQTSVELEAGQRVRIEASGQARMLRLTGWEYLFGFDFDRQVGPEGTYVWPREYVRRSPRIPSMAFPLPAGADGPHPAFCLIGRIGKDGGPFYIGRRYEGIVDRSGRLWLGVNDYELRDNRGAFHARILLDVEPGPPSPERPVVEPQGQGRPIRNARVLLLYIDGLRPDVLHDMAEQGFLPNIKRVFLDEGLECVNAFSTFPSNTLTANGSLFTGLFPDRTGIKSQNQFERTTLKGRGQLSEWIPDWLLFRTTPQPRIQDLLDKFAPENTYQFLRQRGIPTLGSRLGARYRFTILPIAPMNPPQQWPHRALNAIDNPFAAAVRIPSQLDWVNARYVIEELLGDPEARVIAAWFPMVDKVCHFNARGQFGGARREVAVFDRLFGKILMRLRQVGWDKSTYLILMSDHGHLGGERATNRRGNLAYDLFHHQLGWNVRVVGQQWTHPGSDPARFVFLDQQAWGQAAIFLPKGSYHHGPWRPNGLSDLMRYDLGPNRGRVNLLEMLVEFRGPEWAPGLPRPVDLVLVKLDATRVLVYRSSENQAIIHTSLDDDGLERYRYEPIRQIHQTPEGLIQFDQASSDTDPLGYLLDPTVRAAIGPGRAMGDWLTRPHTAWEWLHVSAETEYPDAVVAIAKFFSWKPPVDDLAQVRDPDLVVTASRGWSFRSDGGVGTDHGSPLREAMRISLFLSGPKIRRGVLLEPHRIIDVMPTILEMVNWPYEPTQLDGRPIMGIYE